MHSCLPVFKDGVCGCVVGDVVWGGAARLHEQPGVVGGGRGLDLHEDVTADVVLQRIQTGVDHGAELAVGIELKLVGEGAEAFLHHCDVVSVCCEAQGHVAMFGVLAVELHLQLVPPGDQARGVVHSGDLILEVQVILIFLQSKSLFIFTNAHI